VDAWGKLLSKAVYELVGLPPTPKPCFFTAGLNEDIGKMVESARTGLQWTPFLKVRFGPFAVHFRRDEAELSVVMRDAQIKVDGDYHKGTEVVRQLYDLYDCHRPLLPDWKVGACLPHRLPSFRLPVVMIFLRRTVVRQFSLDANTAWTPAAAREWMRAMAPYRARLYMVEQPFPVDFLQRGTESELREWEAFKAECARDGVVVYADESVCTAEDPPKLQRFVHGVNIKLEKAGGLRGALAAVAVAKRLGLLVWLGTMVGSLLSSSVPAHIFPLVDFGGDLGSPIQSRALTDILSGGVIRWARCRRRSDADKCGVAALRCTQCRSLSRSSSVDDVCHTQGGYTPTGDGMIRLDRLPHLPGLGVVLK
jgi:L-alanine-DL-glutamate epimerase-like enolase superfamily enzyme